MSDWHRTRSKIQELGVESLVDELLARGETYESIAELVKQRTGAEIGKSSIARRNDSIRRKLAVMERTREAARAICQAVTESTGKEPDTKMSEALLGIMQHTIIDKLSGEELSTKDAVGLVLAGSQAVKSASHLEKLKATERMRYQRAFDDVSSQLRSLLEKSGLWAGVEEVLAKARLQIVTE
ncbi:MAG TPA: phage protein Gp27 family protein [Rhizobium sp.]|nr:phage protein Gp27 family protein [Rhizobium sp.]